MLSPLAPLGYNNADERQLRRDLMQAAQSYLQANKDHRFADKRMLGKSFLLIALCGICYFSALLSSHTFAIMFSYAAFMCLALLLAINIVHDASHNAIFRQEWANRWLNLLVTIPLGLDPDCWRVRHIILHHAHTNIQHYDLDIEENGVLRQTPFQRWHPIMRWQHYYWPVVAAFTFPSLIWFYDWADRSGFTQAQRRMRYQGIAGWSLFLLGKSLHLLVTLAIPYFLLAPKGISFVTLFTLYLLSQLLASFIFVMLILGTHWGRATYYQAPANGIMPHGFYTHTFNTTYDWYFLNDAISYWLGGLNLHLTHHLFPNWNHRHYPALSRLIAEVAKKHAAVDYQCVPLKQLFSDQQRFLKAMGKNPNKKST
ncbi:acyl-CoA desaturase [Pseudomonas sp. F1_0610]|uniref:fatty acid desaturase family protein n=1 Tax=Pseudomonas sp. F1_0610 TaxID=3114284 RepID=UPI0039C45AE7